MNTTPLCRLIPILGILVTAFSQTSQLSAADAPPSSKPNIVYILADDLGYGDVKCLGGERSKIPTPNLDKLATQGMIFTEAHSSSAVCTPTRYGILTGRYNWRSTLQRSVLQAYGKTLIAPDRLTVPAFLKQHSYSTAAFGKWHLGWGWPAVGKDGMDFTKPITDGPTARGFDYFFGLDTSACAPFCFIENDHTVGIPSAQITEVEGKKSGKKLGKQGLAAPGWKKEAILSKISSKVCEYIDQQAKSGSSFFVYYALTSPHTPIVPSAAWQGKSGMNSPYADFVMETDAMVGNVMETLEKNGIAENTLIIFTADNGCSPAANLKNLEQQGHFPSEQRRGYKTDIWDGGHRVLFIARWPGKIKAGSRSDDIICLTDLMATSAEIIGAKVPDTAGEDSVSILPALLGKSEKPLREAIVHHSINGNFAIRQGQWKLNLCPDSGGWSKDAPLKTPAQLYDMSKDIGERTNEYEKHPEIVANLTKLLEKYVADGRSTPGPAQKNDVSVSINKKVRNTKVKSE